MLDTWTAGELLFGCASELEEVCAEPYLLQMGLMAAFCYYLLDSILLFALLVFPKPYEGESAPSEQLNFVETVWKPISKDIHLLLAELVRILFFLLPLYLDLLYGFVFLGTESSAGASLLEHFGRAILFVYLLDKLFENALLTSVTLCLFGNTLVTVFFYCVFKLVLFTIGIGLFASHLKVLQAL